jgi:uncharacterized protein YeeX (DUF496 family)
MKLKFYLLFIIAAFTLSIFSSAKDIPEAREIIASHVICSFDMDGSGMKKFLFGDILREYSKAKKRGDSTSDKILSSLKNCCKYMRHIYPNEIGCSDYFVFGDYTLGEGGGRLTHYAAKYDVPEIIPFLEGTPDFDIDRPNYYNETPIMWAALYGSKEFINFVVENKSKYKIKTDIQSSLHDIKDDRRHWQLIDFVTDIQYKTQKTADSIAKILTSSGYISSSARFNYNQKTHKEELKKTLNKFLLGDIALIADWMEQ